MQKKKKTIKTTKIVVGPSPKPSRAPKQMSAAADVSPSPSPSDAPDTPSPQMATRRK